MGIHCVSHLYVTQYSPKYHKFNINTMFHCTFLKVKGKAIPLQALDRPEGFQEVEVPRFQDNRHMKVVRLSAHAPATFTPRKYSWYSFLLEAESTPGP